MVFHETYRPLRCRFGRHGGWGLIEMTNEAKPSTWQASGIWQVPRVPRSRESRRGCAKEAFEEASLASCRARIPFLFLRLSLRWLRVLGRPAVVSDLLRHTLAASSRPRRVDESDSAPLARPPRTKLCGCSGWRRLAWLQSWPRLDHSVYSPAMTCARAASSLPAPEPLLLAPSLPYHGGPRSWC
jgi:hypothetical protein